MTATLDTMAEKKERAELTAARDNVPTGRGPRRC